MLPTVDADRVAIRELVENWALWRDAGDWERFATVWHPTEGWMTATWFQGPARDFIAASRHGFDTGVSILHFLGGHTADVAGDWAIGQTKMTINQRAEIDGVAVDVTCTGRFYDFCARREGEWKIVPKLKCGSASTGVGPIAVFATGKSTAPNFNAAGLIMECSGGKQVMAAAVVVDGVAKQGTVPPVVADLIQVTITSSTTTTTATVKDLTKGHTFTVTKSGKGAAPVQELIIDDSLANGTTQVKLANFGTMTFTSAAVSGKAIGTVTPRTQVNMQTTKKVLQILAGPITGTKKNMFTNTWKHS